jgi:threonine dehydratase
MGLHPDQRSAGVVTASAGNHGLGVAYAAHTFGVPATVYVPENANQLKVDAIERLGASVLRAGLSYHEAYLAAVQDRGGATFVHAYDDPDVIAGQGTAGLEIVEQLPEFDTLLVGVGGGGLIAGIAAYVKALRPGVRIFGAQPRGANSLRLSLDAGRIVTLDRVDTIADGLGAVAPGDIAFDICTRLLAGVYEVSDDEMLRAVRLYFEWEHLLSEPAGAAALAALLYHHAATPGERVVVVLSGANVNDRVMIEALRTS